MKVHIIANNMATIPYLSCFDGCELAEFAFKDGMAAARQVKMQLDTILFPVAIHLGLVRPVEYVVAKPHEQDPDSDHAPKFSVLLQNNLHTHHQYHQ